MAKIIEEEDEWGKYFSGAPVEEESSVVEGGDKWSQYFTNDFSITNTEGEQDWSAYFPDSGSQGPAGYTSDWRAAKELLKQRQGVGGVASLDAYERLTGNKAPDWLTTPFSSLEASGTEGVSGWKPDYPGGVLDNPTLPWMGEQAVTQSGETGLLYGIGIIDEVFGKKVKGLSTVLKSGGVAAIYNPLHAEALQEIAHKNGKKVSELNDKEKDHAAIAAGVNVFLETLIPFGGKLTKRTGLKLKGDSVKKDAKRLEGWLSNATKENIPTQTKEFIKSLAKKGTGEAITEKAEGVVTSAFSDPGLAYELTPEGIEDAASQLAGGFAGGGTFGSPSAYREGTGVNRTISEGARYLDSLNTQSKFKAAEEYLTELNAGPNLKGFDVQPELYDVPTQERGTAKRFMDLLVDKGLGRSTTEFRNALSKTKTGRDVYDLHTQVFGSLAGTESFSGDTQGKPSFNQLKNDKLNEYSTRFFELQSKWSRKIPFAGELGEKINPAIDAYVGARLEGRLTPEETTDVRKLIGKKRLRELDKDIKEIRGIHNKVYKDLKRVLKESDVSLGYTENYLTRGINYKAVKSDKEGFISTLINDVGIEPDKAEGLYNDILNGKDPSTLTSKQIREERERTGKGKSSFEKSRSENWDNLDSAFRDTSSFSSMQNYLVRAATRSASAETFGGRNAEKFTKSIDRLLKRGILTNQGAQTAWDMYDAEHNIYKKPENGQERLWQDFSKGLSTVTAISLLGLASVASLTEPMWIPGRVGFANTVKALPTVAGYVLKGMKRTVYGGRVGKEVDKSFGRQLLNIMGMAINPQVNEKIEMMMAGDYNPALTTWFRTPGGLFLTQYTNFVRTWTAAAGLSMIQDQANKVNRLKGSKLEGLKRELRENGMTINDFKKIVRLGNSKIDILNDEFLNKRYTKDNGTNISVRDSIVPWMRKITTDVALEPTVGNRPLWMSNPNLQLLAQLKSFPILFSNTVMKRTLKQLNPKECTPGITGPVQSLGSLAMALAMAALVLEIKDAIRGTSKDKGPLDVIGAMGIPYVTTDRPSQLVIPAGMSVLDGFSSSFLKIFDGEGGETMEDLQKFLLKIVAGTVVSEQVGR